MNRIVKTLVTKFAGPSLALGALLLVGNATAFAQRGGGGSRGNGGGHSGGGYSGGHADSGRSYSGGGGGQSFSGGARGIFGAQLFGWRRRTKLLGWGTVIRLASYSGGGGKLLGWRRGSSGRGYSGGGQGFYSGRGYYGGGGGLAPGGSTRAEGIITAGVSGHGLTLVSGSGFRLATGIIRIGVAAFMTGTATGSPLLVMRAATRPGIDERRDSAVG